MTVKEGINMVNIKRSDFEKRLEETYKQGRYDGMKILMELLDILYVNGNIEIVEQLISIFKERRF